MQFIVAIDLQEDVSPDDVEEVLHAIAGQVTDVQEGDDIAWPVRDGQVSNGFITGYWKVREDEDDDEPDELEPEIVNDEDDTPGAPNHDD